MTRQRIHVQIDGLLSVHAVRAARTALGSIPGVESAEVSMRGAVLEATEALSATVIGEALAAAGLMLAGLRAEPAGLPVLGDRESERER
jgi:copper chaperone CopZ